MTGKTSEKGRHHQRSRNFLLWGLLLLDGFLLELSKLFPKLGDKRFTSFCWLCVWVFVWPLSIWKTSACTCVCVWCVVVTIWAVCLSSVQASTERDRHVFPWQWAAVAPFVCVGTEVRMTKTTARAHTLKEAHRNNYAVLSLSLVGHPTPWKPAWCPAN